MLTRPMNDGEKGLMQMYVNNGYDLFLTRCSDGRGISKEDLDKIAQGRVWTGSKAKELGLVDELGGFGQSFGHCHCKGRSRYLYRDELSEKRKVSLKA